MVQATLDDVGQGRTVELLMTVFGTRGLMCLASPECVGTLLGGQELAILSAIDDVGRTGLTVRAAQYDAGLTWADGPSYW